MVRSPLVLLLLCPQLSLGATLDVPSEHLDITLAMVAADSNDTIRIDATAYTGELGLIEHLIVLKSLRFEGVNGSPTIPGMAIAAGLDIDLADLRIDGPVIDIGVLAMYRQEGGSLNAERVILTSTLNTKGIHPARNSKHHWPRALSCPSKAGSNLMCLYPARAIHSNHGTQSVPVAEAAHQQDFQPLGLTILGSRLVAEKKVACVGAGDIEINVSITVKVGGCPCVVKTALTCKG